MERREEKKEEITKTRKVKKWSSASKIKQKRAIKKEGRESERESVSVFVWV